MRESIAVAVWLAQVELTSEDPACPIDAALRPSPTPGWRAAEPGAQRIRLVFDHPQALHRLRLVFAEPQQARTQEFVVRWSADGGQSRPAGSAEHLDPLPGQPATGGTETLLVCVASRTRMAM